MELNLHKSTQWAFIDGALCGALVAILVIKAHKDAKERKHYAEELLNAENQIYELRR